VPATAIIEKDGERVGLGDLLPTDLILNASRYRPDSFEISRLVVRSPLVNFDGVVRGFNQETHTVTVELAGGDQVRLLITTKTEFSDTDGFRGKFAEVSTGDRISVGKYSSVEVGGAIRNVATTLFMQPATMADIRGVVADVDAEGGTLVVDSLDGEIVELSLPAEDPKIKLIKDDLNIDDLATIVIGDIVGLAVYLPETETIVSLTVVTPGARAASGQAAALDPVERTIIVVLPAAGRLALQVSEDSELFHNGENALFEVLNSGDFISRVLYVPDFDLSDNLDGRIIRLSAVGREKASSDRLDLPFTNSLNSIVQARLSGALEIIDDNLWAIAGREFLVTDRARIVGDVQDGALATVTVQGISDGSFEAIRVTIKAPPPPPPPVEE
jgi:hypothetical protein